MDRTVGMVTIFIVSVLLITSMTIYLVHIVGVGRSQISAEEKGLSSSVQIIGSSINENDVASINVEGNFTVGDKVIINIPKLLSENNKNFNKIVSKFGYPQFTVTILAIDDVVTGYKPVVYATTYDTSGKRVLYSTLGDEVTSMKNGFWISLVDFTCYNDDGEKVGVTLLSGSICGKVVVNGSYSDVCFFRLNILIHNPTVKIEELPPLSNPPNNFIID